MELWYQSPAQKWMAALPVGNGRIGAMVYGDWLQENIQLNEESVWAGSKINNNNPQAKAHLKEIQQAIFQGDYKKAHELSDLYLVGTPRNVSSYQPLGNLFVHYHWKGQPTAYRRSLNLHNGISTTAYTIDGNSVQQEVYASAPQDLIVVSITADKAFDVDPFLSRQFDSVTEVKEKRKKVLGCISNNSNQYQAGNKQAWYTGQIVDKESASQGPGGNHMRYATVMKIISIDGNSTAFKSHTSAGFKIRSAKKIVLVLTGAMDYNFEKLDLDKSIQPLSVCNKIISTAAPYNAVALNQLHVLDHQKFFDRVSFSLGDDDQQQLPTDQRLARMKTGETDNGLLALYYQYGRYLLMGSSRKPGKLPANLQGIWNDLYDAPWNADFHTNINLQMNYWPAETGNLPETAIPLSSFVNKLTVPGAVTAKEMYGARGWTMHHLTDPFGRTGVMDGVWGITPMDGS